MDSRVSGGGSGLPPSEGGAIWAALARALSTSSDAAPDHQSEQAVGLGMLFLADDQCWRPPACDT